MLLRMSGGQEIPVQRLLDPARDPGHPGHRSPGCTSTRRWWTTSWTWSGPPAIPARSGWPQLKPLVAFGASPRASIALAQAARAHAFLRGRGYVVPEDVRALALDVLRHRMVLTFEAEAEEMDSDDRDREGAGGRPGAMTRVPSTER